MQVRAALLEEVHRPFRIETLDLEPPRAGEVLVRIEAAGVCHSDWNLVTGATRHPLPVVAGHEAAGVVEEVGPGTTGLRKGDHVALSWAPGCGSCFHCARGRPALCSAFKAAIWAGTLLDGTVRLHRGGQAVRHYCALAAFAERAVVPRASCVPLGAAVPPPVAALLGCAATTGLGAVLNTARVPRGSSLAVYGAGGVGLSAVLAARLAGAEPVVVVEPRVSRRELALSLGAHQALVPGPEVPERIRQATSGRGADFVLDATGVPAVQEECFRAARAGGTVVLVGLAPMDSLLRLPGADLAREEKTVTGSYYGSADPARDFPRYAQLYLEGKLALDRLVGRQRPLDEINEAYQDLLDGDGGRQVLVP